MRASRPNPYRHPPRDASRRQQRGAATLLVSLVLFVAMLLAATYASRSLLSEQRASANQLRATQAFEAAEAGLEWALAQLNTNRRIGTDCLDAPADPGLDSFRQRYLRTVPGAGGAAMLSGATWIDATQARPLQAACVRTGAGWACHCPRSGPAQPAVPDSAVQPGNAAAFSIEFSAADRPGVVRLIAHGCSQPAAPCRAGATRQADATARIEVSLGRLSALATPPLATLTLRGALRTDAAIGVHNADPASGGIAVHAGGAVDAPNLRLTAPAATPVDAALAQDDAALASRTADEVFAAHFGAPPSAWPRLPGVQRIDCPSPCGDALVQALASAGQPALLWVPGDAEITGPIALGSAQQPLILVVAGTLRLRGGVQIHGLVHAAATRWDDTGAGGAWLRGALISSAGHDGDGAPDLHYDAALLAALRDGAGGFARVGGSWRDF